MNPETKKAFEYLRKRGYEYFCNQVWENGVVIDISATFAEVSSKHVEHVRKTYPHAAIFFSDNITVSQENHRRDIAFAEVTGRVSPRI